MFKPPPPVPEIRAYHAVPPETTIVEYVFPDHILKWQLARITRWQSLADRVLEDYPDVPRIIVMGIIAQESQGDPRLVCDFNGMGEMCGVGLMQVVPRPWTGTKEQLFNPLFNIYNGVWILDSAMKKAVSEYNYRPGDESTRAALAAYNCGWESLHEDRCYYFGGWAYADKVINYWIPLLQGELNDEENFATFGDADFCRGVCSGPR